MFTCPVCSKSFDKTLSLNAHLGHCRGNRPKQYKPKKGKSLLDWDGGDKDRILQMVATHDSKAQVLRGLGLVITGCNHKRLSRFLLEHSVDTSHLKGQGHGRAGRPQPRRDLEDILVFGTSYHNPTLLKRLVEAGYRDYKCSECGNPGQWNGKPLSLQLDHVDGNPLNNVLDNLRVVCPNCHSQTPTFGGRNKKKN